MTKAVGTRPALAIWPLCRVSSVLQQVYDIGADDAKLRALKRMKSERAAESFHRLRNDYQLRPEFRHFIVDLTERHWDLAGTFAALGFKVKTQKGGRVG